MNVIRSSVLVCALLFGVACNKGDAAPGESGAAAAGAGTQLSLVVDAAGYHPATLSAPAGRPVHLTIKRTSDEGCGQQIAFPSLNLRKDLPLNQPVTVEFAMPASGSISFACGMDMMRGSIVAQ